MLKVLIADDERIVRKTLRLIGNWDKYEMELVGEAQNGIEVLEMIERLTPDILLLDMKMPGLSGNQILEQLAEYINKCIAPSEKYAGMAIDKADNEKTTTEEVKEATQEMNYNPNAHL